MKYYYNRASKDLKPIPIGSRVWIQDRIKKTWDKIGEVIEIGKNRNYTVQIPSGRIYARNRKFLRQAVPKGEKDDIIMRGDVTDPEVLPGLGDE